MRRRAIMGRISGGMHRRSTKETFCCCSPPRGFFSAVECGGGVYVCIFTRCPQGKQEPPPTQLAASHVCMSKSLLAYTFRAAIGRCRTSRREFVFVCCVHLSSRRWLLPPSFRPFFFKNHASRSLASHSETSARGQSRKLLPRSLRLAISTYPMSARERFSGRDRAWSPFTQRSCVCVRLRSHREVEVRCGAISKIIVLLPWVLILTRLPGAKEEAPPTQLAASHVYISQYLLAYAFRAANTPCRGAKRVRETSTLRARAIFRVSQDGSSSHPAAPASYLFPLLCSSQSYICVMRLGSSVVCGVGACLCVMWRVFKRPRGSAVGLRVFFRRPDRQMEDTRFALPVPPSPSHIDY